MEPKESKSNRHFILSLIKSVTRIFAGLSFCFNHVFLAGAFLILAEILGIAEEL
jgi:hypothetical protein